MQTSGVYMYDFRVPVPLLGRLPAAQTLMAAAPYGRPALVPGMDSIVISLTQIS